MESERALQQVIFSIMSDNMELFKQFQNNPSFKKWLSDMVFHLTYNPEGKINMSGNRIDVKTLDLNQEFSEIARQLKGIAKDFFEICREAS